MNKTEQLERIRTNKGFIAALDQSGGSTPKALLWNGPLGAFEVPPFDQATSQAAKFVSERTKNGDLISVAGGGDTVAALNKAGVTESFTYVSTAGGAFLEWLEGKDLPGVLCLTKN